MFKDAQAPEEHAPLAGQLAPLDLPPSFYLDPPEQDPPAFWPRDWVVLRDVVITLSSFALTVFFAAFIHYGTYGTSARQFYDTDLARLQAQRERLRSERDDLLGKIHGLSDESLDFNLLEKQIRKVLGYARPDDIFLVPAAPK